MGHPGPVVMRPVLHGAPGSRADGEGLRCYAHGERIRVVGRLRERTLEREAHQSGERKTKGEFRKVPLRYTNGNPRLRVLYFEKRGREFALKE